jgi:APA family basic amino acid/polyamine antiporter
MLGELISIGILLAFGVVCIGVLVLRFNQPQVPRPFRVPVAAIFCPVGALLCFGLTLWLPVDTWWRLAIWSVVGGSIYVFYGYKHSHLRDSSK